MPAVVNAHIRSGGRPPGRRPWHAVTRLRSVVLVIALRPVAAPPAPVALPVRPASAADAGEYISFEPVDGGFTLAAAGRAAPLVVGGDDFPGVTRTVNDFRDDVQ